MYFEGRELKNYAEPVPPEKLEENEICFSVHYVDNQLLIPELEAVIFVGRNLRPQDTGLVYFQDIDSYRQGTRFGAPQGDAKGTFMCIEEQDVSVYDYEHALNLLLACSLRRKALGLK